MPLRKTTIKRYKKVQATFAKLSAETSGIVVKGRMTKKYSVEEAIQLTANRHDFAYASVEKILKLDLDNEGL